ncbi:hypothetical protein CERSUDRAFT_106439, partial [Gelatoporia subvermispora B]
MGSPPTSSPPTDLRHITSSTNLTPSRERKVSNRNSQHIRTHRLGSRSPASIPSSPTSVHSSSSAIFERDVEPLTPSPAAPHADPHRIPRGKLTEPLEQAIPSVLDSAAEALAGPDDDDLDAISIVAAVPRDGYQSGVTSPISRLSSRSPSPTAADNRRSLLFSTNPLSGSPPSRPTLQTSIVPPLAMSAPAQGPQAATTTPTPTSAYFSVNSDAGSEASSPTTATHTEHPLHTLTPPPAPIQPALSQSQTQTTITLPSHPPSPAHAPKRLSFLSYIDILSSTPSAALPLSSLTSASEPPPHLPSVLGVPQHAAAGSASGSVHLVANAAALPLEREAGQGILDDGGGEWEREGLGRGLEERLEALNSLPVTLPGRAHAPSRPLPNSVRSPLSMPISELPLLSFYCAHIVCS